MKPLGQKLNPFNCPNHFCKNMQFRREIDGITPEFGLR